MKMPIASVGLSLALLFGGAEADVVKLLDFETAGVPPSADPGISFIGLPLDESVVSVSGGFLTGNSMPSEDCSLAYRYNGESEHPVRAASSGVAAGGSSSGAGAFL